MEQETAGLVRRMAEGDSQAFDRLMEFYIPKYCAWHISYPEVMQTVRILYRKPLCCAG